MEKIFNGQKPAKLGTKTKPAVVNVKTKKRLKEVASIFEEKGWKYTIELDPDKPEDITDLEILLNPPKSKIAENLVDAADAITGIPDFSPNSSAPNMSGHGGEFGGGGASGAWTEAGGEAETASAVGETATEAVGGAVSGLADEGGIILIPLILFLIVLFGGGIYLIFEAPVIISEAAFELILATTLIKKARSIDSPNWIGSVFRATWPAFALTLVITVIAGWALMTYCPQANEITAVFRYCI